MKYWFTLFQGTEIHEPENSDPGVAVGPVRFGGVDFFGTFYVADCTKEHADLALCSPDDDFIGFVFG